MILYVSRVGPELVLVQAFCQDNRSVHLEHVLVSEPELCDQLLLLAALGAPEGASVSGAVDLTRYPAVAFFDGAVTPQSYLHYPLTVLDNPEYARPIMASRALVYAVSGGRSIGGLVFRSLHPSERADKTFSWRLDPTLHFPSSIVSGTRASDSGGAGFHSRDICTTHKYLVRLAQNTAQFLNSTGVTS